MSFSPEENYDEFPSQSARAADRVSVPGILLIIVGVINLLWALYGVFEFSRAAMATPEELAARQKEFVDMLKQALPQIADQVDQQMKQQDPQQLKTQNMLINGPLTLLFVLCGILPLLAGIRMRNLRGYGLAVTGAIFALLPCITPGCCLFAIGPIAGIWSLVVLSNVEVKAAFR
jgi:uncharacterized membrane protein HdeD (DUF308 family)